MVEYKCKCGGTITEDSPGIDWNDEGEYIWRDDLVCGGCGKAFNVYYMLERISCNECDEDVECEKLIHTTSFQAPKSPLKLTCDCQKEKKV